MWLILAFGSAFLLGFYDVFKKKALHGNAVIPVLFFNTLISAALFCPFILNSFDSSLFGGFFYAFDAEDWHVHKYVFVKAIIVLSSWIFGYFAMKHLPLTIVGPMNATRPIFVLLGAIIFFSERLNVLQWSGVLLALCGIFLLAYSGRSEGVSFRNKWVIFLFVAVLLGALSGLYDKYIMQRINPLFVQAWFNVYQLLLMLPIVLLSWYPKRKHTTPFRWHWAIVLIPLFLSAADFLYFRSLSYDDALISVVSMVRRGSVLVSFTFGALLFKEKNLKFKMLDLFLIAVSMILLYMGSE